MMQEDLTSGWAARTGTFGCAWLPRLSAPASVALMIVMIAMVAPQPFPVAYVKVPAVVAVSWCQNWLGRFVYVKSQLRKNARSPISAQQ
jgi:hypothetical protein